MDPLTQGTLGAAFPQAVAQPEHTRLALLCGLLGGMAPDLDVLIRSGSDPLLFLEYHRQFTHSLIFIPVGALLVSLFIWGLVGRQQQWPLSRIFLFCFLGYSTHALLDACTTYGTQLFWPFSDRRIAWNNVSIIDPILTLPLLGLVVFSFVRRNRYIAVAAMVWVISYLSLGVYMRDEAIAAGLELAASRGHQPELLEAKPSFANIVVWKTVYKTQGYYYVDAVNLLGEGRVYEGQSVAALELARDFPWLAPGSLQARDVERFRWFSNGYLAKDPLFPNRIMDLRYSLLPNQIRPLWSIELREAQQNEIHVSYATDRARPPGVLKDFWTMLRGQPLPPE